MNDAAPDLQAPELVELKPTRERKAYNLNVVVAQLRDDARELDGELEAAMTDLYMAFEDGRIDEAEAKGLLLSIFRAFRVNSSVLNTLNLLDESGSEAALREVQRTQAKRKRRGK